MAEQTSELGDELICCTICFERFTSPKTLHCLHTFCEPCLKRHLAAYIGQHNDLVHPILLPCPTCRESTPLPDSGISGLRTDFKISKIKDLLLQLGRAADDKCPPTACSICATVHRMAESTSHCKECCAYFCDDCVLRHKNTELFDSHTVRPLQPEAKNKAFCAEHDSQVLRYFCQSCSIHICTLCSMTEHMMHNLTDVDQGKAKLKRAQKIQDLLEKVDGHLKQMVEFEEKIGMSEESVFLSFNETAEGIKKRAAEVSKQVQEEKRELLNKLQKQFQRKMAVLLFERETVVNYKRKLVDLKSEAWHSLANDKGEAFLETSCELIGTLKRASQVQFLNPGVFHEAESAFQLIPTTLSQFPQLLGHLKDGNISSNLQLTSRVPVRLIAKLGGGSPVTQQPLEARPLDWPLDACFTQDGRLVVADTENFQLLLLSKEGRLLQTIGAGQVKPVGVVATPMRTLAVTDMLDNCVKIFGEDGQLLFEFGSQLFASPAGICINGFGEYVVSDVGLHFVNIHNSGGEVLARLGGFGSRDTDLNCPCYVATNQDNDIIVSDMGNQCIKVFNYDLDLLVKIEDPGNLICPSGVALDIQGHILVCDSCSDMVLMYRMDGEFIARVLSEEDGVCGPLALCVNDAGQMALSMRDNSDHPRCEVRIYQLYD